MSTFAFPTEENAELAANMDTFVGKDIAVQALSLDTVAIKTESYGFSQALRVTVINLDTGEMTSPHLLFWSKVQEQLIRTQRGGTDWTVGRIENIPQHSDPTRSVYLLKANADLDANAVGATIAKAEAGTVHSAVDENAPF